MGKKKRIVGMYSAWNYTGEIEDMNRRSQAGWQMIKGGLFSSQYEYDPNVRYVYQLDFEPQISDMGRYIDMFREQGWDYVNSTFNGWHFFRKLYDPDLPASEYEIFTDRESLTAMRGRWARIAAILIAFVSVGTIALTILNIIEPQIPSIVQTLVMLIELAIFIKGLRVMKNPDMRSAIPGDRQLFALFLVVFILGIGLSVGLRTTRADVNGGSRSDNRAPIAAQIPADWHEAYEEAADGAILLNSADVILPDWYYLDLDMSADNPITFSIIDDEGNVVWSKTGDSINTSDTRLWLTRGAYGLFISDFEGGRLDIKYELD